MASVQEMIMAAKAGVENLSPAEVAAEVDEGDVLLVDVREPAETVDGFIPTAVFAPRGMLEFYADATSPHHMAWFQPDQRIIVYSATGSRSALAAAGLQDLGYRDVAHLDGGYQRWLDEEWPVLPIEPVDPRDALPQATPAGAHLELVLPEDNHQYLLRVRLNDEWIGDLLFSSLAQRDSTLGALTEGAVSIARRPIPIADFTIAETPSALLRPLEDEVEVLAPG